MTGKLVVISGPSGVGKSTIVHEALRRTPAEFSVSVTTRARRAGEADGSDYRFVDRKTFGEMIARGELMEWAEVFGELYGTPAAPIREAMSGGRTVVLDIDVKGAMQVYAHAPEATFVLIVPPNREELSRRLKRRGSESPDALGRRLQMADEEMQSAASSGIYNYVVVNDDLETAIRRVVDIVSGKAEPGDVKE